MMIWQYSLQTRVYPTRAEMGRAAAKAESETLRALLERQEEARMIFAAAPSQNEFLEALCQEERVDFSRVVAFHMDEYVGLPADAPQGFGNFLRERLFAKLPFRRVHYLNGGAADPEAECARYAALLGERPVDIVCMGIGENGHIAFNDPHAADLNDPRDVKVVELDGVCRMQQVHDGCFARLEDVPERALTLTASRLRRAGHHFCIVPAATKRAAVRRTLYGPVDNACPATALRLCPDARLYLDRDSAGEL